MAYGVQDARVEVQMIKLQAALTDALVALAYVLAMAVAMMVWL